MAGGNGNKGGVAMAMKVVEAATKAGGNGNKGGGNGNNGWRLQWQWQWQWRVAGGGQRAVGDEGEKGVQSKEAASLQACTHYVKQ
jgi:hypothetical protein